MADISDEAARGRAEREAAAFLAARPATRAAAGSGAEGFIDGVPLHWMTDWPMPAPLVIGRAEGAQLLDIDGHVITDLCLGDTGAMFGHAPEPVVRALRESAERGLTHMLPSADAAAVGRLLAGRFGLPHWQVATTASDANRFAIRVARAVTGRPKVLVFDGCYHGAVDDTLVDLVDGATRPRASLIGQIVDTGATSMAIPFNDEAALAAALAQGDIAVVLAEPVMTNCGMILPRPGFLEALRRLTREAGTLLLIDETHTLSSALGGYARSHGLEPDILVAGKAIAGGVPAAVWGLAAPVARRLAELRAAHAAHGHSGIGTTLSGSALQLAAMRACLEEVMTAEAYATMAAQADLIEAGLSATIRRLALPWHVARVGARLEVVFAREAVADAAGARAAQRPALERALHLALLNRGFLLTPFHNMVLVSPALPREEAERFVAAFDAVVAGLAGAAPSEVAA